MSILTKAESEVEHLLTPILHGKTDDPVEDAVLADARAFKTLAKPIVQTIQTDLKAVAPSDQTGLNEAIQKFLNKCAGYGDFTERVEAYVAMPAADRWQKLAVFALERVVPADTDLAMLNLGVELAYNVLKRSLAPKAPAPKTAA